MFNMPPRRFRIAQRAHTAVAGAGERLPRRASRYIRIIGNACSMPLVSSAAINVVLVQ
jgi:hypothetical protein